MQPHNVTHLLVRQDGAQNTKMLVAHSPPMSSHVRPPSDPRSFRSFLGRIVFHSRQVTPKCVLSKNPADRAESTGSDCFEITPS